EYETQREFGHGQSAGNKWSECLGMINASAQVFRNKIGRPPVILWKNGVFGERSCQCPFVERNAGNHANVKFSAQGEQSVFRRLIEDVVNHLNGIDKSCLECIQYVVGLPPVHADA